MTVIIDYGVGNLFSLQSSLAAVGEEAVISADPAVIAAADRVILPGVGAFGDAADRLRETGLDQAVRSVAAAGVPLLGICLGMQLLFERSHEFGLHEGLGLIPGEVIPMQGTIPAALKIPHIGWNALTFHCAHPLMKYVQPGEHVYFVHSFYASGCEEALVASAEYGVQIPATVAAANVMGCQFHPEKSGRVGLNILRAFCEMRRMDA